MPFQRPICLLMLTLIALSGCSSAHIVVVDQNENPIEGVLVRSNIQPGNAFFFSDETTVRYTDEEGEVTLPVGRWFEINLVKKEGYQFRPFDQFKQEFGDYAFGNYAKKFTSDNPLVIKGWKRGQQPELTYVGGKFVLPDDIEQCTLELVQPNEENGLDAPLVLEIKLETEFVPAQKKLTTPTRKFVADKWQGYFRVYGAQLQDTNDLFLNRAPQSGYQNEIVYRSEGFPSNYAEKHLFIKGTGDDFFGGALFFLNPDRGTKASLDEVNAHVGYFQIWFNFNGSTNVMRSLKQTTWTDLGWQMDKGLYCRETPRFVDD